MFNLERRIRILVSLAIASVLVASLAVSASAAVAAPRAFVALPKNVRVKKFKHAPKKARNEGPDKILTQLKQRKDWLS